MNRTIIALLSAIVLMAGCQTTNKVPTDDIVVAAETDPKANIAGYKTYNWFAAAGILNDPEGRWQPPQFDAEAEIEFLIDEQLREHGFTEVADGSDIAVIYSVGIDMAALKVSQDPDSGVDTLEDVPAGALLVVLVDTETGFAIWAGSAAADIRGLGPDAAKERLAYAIEEMFKDLTN